MKDVIGIGDCEAYLGSETDLMQEREKVAEGWFDPLEKVGNVIFYLDIGFASKHTRVLDEGLNPYMSHHDMDAEDQRGLPVSPPRHQSKDQRCPWSHP